MRRCSSKISSSPLVALALFLLVVCSSSFYRAAAARPRPLQPAVPLPPLIAHHENGAKAAAAADADAAAAAADGVVLGSAAGVVSGDELSVSSEVTNSQPKTILNPVIYIFSLSSKVDLSSRSGSSILQMMGADQSEEEAGVACEEGKDEECMQRRLLHDAHIDYIYTQHKGKP